MKVFALNHLSSGSNVYSTGFLKDAIDFTLLETITQDVIKSSEIEGEILDFQEVCSSVARKLGLEISGLGKNTGYVLVY